MVGMVCQPCYMAGGHPEVGYVSRMTGVGPYFWGQIRVCCPECAAELVVGLLVEHLQDQHGMVQVLLYMAILQVPYPSLYRVSLPRAAGSAGCPVESCKGQATTRTKLWISLLHLCVQDTIVFMEEGDRPFCPACDIFVPWS